METDHETYKFRNYANCIARRFSDRLRVIYECRCISDRKIKHHFDYYRPYDVFLLCPACHNAEHRRLNAARKRTIMDNSDFEEPMIFHHP